MEVGHSCTPGEGQKQSPVMGTLPRRGPAEPMERLSESGHLGPQKEGPGRRGRGRKVRLKKERLQQTSMLGLGGKGLTTHLMGWLMVDSWFSTGQLYASAQ